MATKNEFKAAAERKKRMSEMRKAKTFISRLQEVLDQQDLNLASEDMESVQAALDKLNEVVIDASVEVDVFTAANEKAQQVLDSINEKLAKQEESPVEETQETSDPEESVAETSDAPAEEVPAQEAPVNEAMPVAEETPEITAEPEVKQVAEAPTEPETKELSKEEKEKYELSELLHDLYSSPRYSRLKGETKTRFSALIKPTLIKKMRADQEEGRITSPNDLINGLLEIYYGEY